jgi:D-tyrosyl-tRNA(Tyr) deacylase
MRPGRTKSGTFGADMDVGLVNWGPVTIDLDSRDFSPPGEASAC